MSDKKRVDVALVERGLAQSREKAQALVMSGVVYIGENKVDKASTQVTPEDELIVRQTGTGYVSRGALKLEKGLAVFGVEAKEQLRERVRQVDTLTLSATPIPRTLNMALSGVRDMSGIEQPPQDRQPVQTYVLEHDWGRAGRRDAPRDCPRRTGLLPAQPRRGHRVRRRADRPAPRRGGKPSASRTARCPSASSAASCSRWPTATCRCSSARRSSRRASTFRT